jgi:DNA-binding transcriptional regulator YiaG
MTRVRDFEGALLKAANSFELPDPATRRALREKAGLSQIELADAIGVSRWEILRWERGQVRPTGAARDRYWLFLRFAAGENALDSDDTT